MTDYPFDQIFAADPSNPANIAAGGVVTIYAPGDAAKTPVALKTLDGLALANPLPVNKAGFGPAFISQLWQVAWSGGGFSGVFTSNLGLRDEAVAAVGAAQSAQSAASDSAGAAQAAQAAAEEAAATSTGGGAAVDPADPDTLLISTKTDGSVVIDPADADNLLITT